MRAVVSFVACGLIAACFDPHGAAGTDPTGDAGPAGSDGATGDGSIDTLGPWGSPIAITVAADPTRSEDDSTLSYSGRELVFTVGGGSGRDLYHATRPDLASPFGPATPVPFSLAGISEETPRFSLDDRTLYFARTNDPNRLDIYRVARPAAGSTEWGTPELVSEVNTSGAYEKGFVPCADDRYVVVRGNNLWAGRLGVDPPVAIAELNTTATETGPFVTPDCLTIYFASTRDGSIQLYTSTRETVTSAWDPPVLFDAFAALGGNQSDPFLSSDGRTFVFVSDASGSLDVYVSTR